MPVFGVLGGETSPSTRGFLAEAPLGRTVVHDTESKLALLQDLRCIPPLPELQVLSITKSAC